MNLNIILIGIVILCFVLYINSKNKDTFLVATDARGKENLFSDFPLVNDNIDLTKFDANYGQTNDEIIIDYINSTINNPSYLKRKEALIQKGEHALIVENANAINEQAMNNRIELEKLDIELINMINFNNSSCVNKI